MREACIGGLRALPKAVLCLCSGGVAPPHARSSCAHAACHPPQQKCHRPYHCLNSAHAQYASQSLRGILIVLSNLALAAAAPEPCKMMPAVLLAT